MSRHYVYVIQCDDDTLYTGYTTDPERRVAEHDAGEGAKYTRCRTPVELVHLERYDSQSAAMSREHAIKSLTRAQKEQLVHGNAGVNVADRGFDGKDDALDGEDDALDGDDDLDDGDDALAANESIGD